MENDMNFNYSECIKSYDKLGETIYQNICNNEKTSVPWGVSGYSIAIIVILLGLLLVTFIIMIIKDYFD